MLHSCKYFFPRIKELLKYNRGLESLQDDALLFEYVVDICNFFDYIGDVQVGVWFFFHWYVMLVY